MEVKEITVQTDQEVKVFGPERMVLTDVETAQAIAIAERTGGHTWTVTAADDSTDPVTTDDRGTAIDAMNTIALTVGDADGYSVLEPNFDIDGEIVSLRQLDNYIQTSPE